MAGRGADQRPVFETRDLAADKAASHRYKMAKAGHQRYRYTQKHKKQARDKRRRRANLRARGLRPCGRRRNFALFGSRPARKWAKFGSTILQSAGGRSILSLLAAGLISPLLAKLEGSIFGRPPKQRGNITWSAPDWLAAATNQKKERTAFFAREIGRRPNKPWAF